MSNGSARSSAVITGGLGFIGSSLAHHLLERGVSVHVIDAELDAYGANRFNLRGIEDDVDVHRTDVRDGDELESIVAAVDPEYVFHLAAQLSRPESMADPATDIDINLKGTINVLESVRPIAETTRVVFASSQAVYGSPRSLPIDEDTAPNPIDVYGANKLTGERYCGVYGAAYDIDSTVVRLTNVYGPRAQLSNPNYGVVNAFIRESLTDGVLTVYDPGTMRRDLVYVDDVVEALVSAATTPDAGGETYVVGSGESISIMELARTIVATAGQGRVALVEWPDSWRSIKVGDIITDPSKIQTDLGWEPTTTVDEGLEKTISYYKRYQNEYIDQHR